jgi:hypothetical protein
MNTEVKETELEIELTAQEKQAILEARERAQQQQENSKAMQEFYAELEALCDKHQVAPQLVNKDLLQLVQLLPDAIGKQQLVWKKLES